jgi:hypothetical protein
MGLIALDGDLDDLDFPARERDRQIERRAAL